ncbi:hypothetical protein D3C79_996550 [compost metagenome]
MQLEGKAAVTVFLQPVFVIETFADAGDSVAQGLLVAGEVEVHGVTVRYGE